MLSKPLQQLCRHSSTSSVKSSTLGILGVPFAKGQRKAGVDLAPDLLRENNLIKTLESAAYGSLTVKDYGNLKFASDPDSASLFKNTRNYSDFMGCNKALIKKVREILEENDQILTIGGDHAIGFGTVAGHLTYNPNVSLVWVDAHADINVPTTSGSGNIHGMPVSLLLKELRQYWKDAKLEKFAPNCLQADQLVYIGLRDVDPYEAYLLNKLGIRAYGMDAVDRFGIQKIIEMTLDALKPTNKIHVSFDIDALDSIWAPSTGTVVPGGLTLREGLHIVEALRDTNRVEGIDLVEVNPKLGSEADVQKTVTAALEILKSVCGYKRAGSWKNINMDLLHNTN